MLQERRAVGVVALADLATERDPSSALGDISARVTTFVRASRFRLSSTGTRGSVAS
ncbi:hypothetical protein [Streptomyces sp. NPDC050856]|uniref:hypothetical protein n=1 Tax=Streptomyces sp. NPDC050856 TaxID=3154939 RepID=UPI0033C849AF